MFPQGTLTGNPATSPTTEAGKDWCKLIDSAEDEALLRRLFFDWCETKNIPTLPPWKTTRPLSESSREIVLHILANPNHTLEVMEDILNTPVADECICQLFALNERVTADVISRWNNIFPIVAKSDHMQLKRLLTTDPRRILDYASNIGCLTTTDIYEGALKSRKWPLVYGDTWKNPLSSYDMYTTSTNSNTNSTVNQQKMLTEMYKTMLAEKKDKK